VPDSLEWCDLVMREDWIRNFWPFTLVESLGYLCGKLGFLDKYCVRIQWKYGSSPSSIFLFVPLRYRMNLQATA
jgi:hypothetical protein